MRRSGVRSPRLYQILQIAGVFLRSGRHRARLSHVEDEIGRCEIGHEPELEDDDAGPRDGRAEVDPDVPADLRDPAVEIGEAVERLAVAREHEKIARPETGDGVDAVRAGENETIVPCS